MKLFLWDFFLRLVTDAKRKLHGFVFKIARSSLNKYSNQLGQSCELGMCNSDKAYEQNSSSIFWSLGHILSLLYINYSKMVKSRKYRSLPKKTKLRVVLGCAFTFDCILF